MKTTKWTGLGHTHAWANAQNWSNGAPVALESVSFNDGAAWTIGLGGAPMSGAITVSRDRLVLTGGTLTAASPQPARGLAADLTLGNAASLTLTASATLVSPDLIDVGAAAADGSTTAGALTVHGTLTAGVVSLLQGTVAVTGPAAHLTIATGGQTIAVGAGALTVADGGTVDAGPNTLATFYSHLTIGSGAAAGTVSVLGAGSSLTIGIISAGNGDDGVINVAAGGALHAGVIYAGQNGDGLINVTGAGSLLTAVNAIEIGDTNVLPVASALTITNHGNVSGEVLLNYGLLRLDASASLTGTIVSQIGKIEALASSTAGNTVTLNNAFYLESNNGTQGQYDHNTTIYAQQGATLDLTGTITGEQDAVLSAGSGHVVLDNTNNTYGATALYNAHLEIAATGAAGAGTLTFTGGSTGQAPTLQIDAGVAFANTIAGFTGTDSIDLQGFAFGTGVTDRLVNAHLVVSNASASDTLSVAGNYIAGNFSFSDDRHGGTLITFDGNPQKG